MKISSQVLECIRNSIAISSLKPVFPAFSFWLYQPKPGLSLACSFLSTLSTHPSWSGQVAANLSRDLMDQLFAPPLLPRALSNENCLVMLVVFSHHVVRS